MCIRDRDTTPPTVVGVRLVDLVVNGQTQQYAAVEFNEAIDLPTGTLAYKNFTLQVNGTNREFGGAFLVTGQAGIPDNRVLMIRVDGTPIVPTNGMVLDYRVQTYQGNPVPRLTDLAGNQLQDFQYTVDITPPVFQSATTNTRGTAITLTYDEAMRSPLGLSTSAFLITVNGVTTNPTAAVVVDGKVVLTPSTPILAGQTVTFQYTDPTAGDDYDSAQDLNGNDAASLPAGTPVANITDTTGPVLQGAVTSPDGLKVTLTYNEALGATTAPASAFTVKVNGVARTVTAVVVSGNTIELTLASAATRTDTLTVGYTAPTPNDATTNLAVQDVLGNDSLTVSNFAVTNGFSDLSLIHI